MGVSLHILAVIFCMAVWCLFAWAVVMFLNGQNKTGIDITEEEETLKYGDS